MFGDGFADMGEHRQGGEGRPHGVEFAGRELAETIGVFRREAEQVGGSGNVAVEHIEPDKEVLEFGDHRGVELRQALCRDHRGNAALAASRAEISQRGDADPARFRVARGPGMMGGEQVTFVDAHEDGVCPMLGRRADQSGEQRRGLEDTLVGVEVGEVDVER